MESPPVMLSSPNAKMRKSFEHHSIEASNPPQTTTESDDWFDDETDTAPNDVELKRWSDEITLKPTKGQTTKKKTLIERIKSCRNRVDDEQRIFTYAGCGVDNISPNRRFAANKISNTKYSILTFLPQFLWEQFNQFWNFYFLCVCLSQIFEQLQVGFWFTYWGPLGFVITMSLIREIYDDLCRFRQDRAVNTQKYKRIQVNPETGLAEAVTIQSAKIRVGDLIVLEEDQRVPADMVLLWCSDEKGSTFLRTDQLDGETDWKLRRPIPSAQAKYAGKPYTELARLTGQLTVEPPHPKIYDFLGTFASGGHEVEPLNLENTLWASTVVAAGTIVGAVSYTGKQTRAMLNSNESVHKTGRIDLELNFFAKCLFVMMITLAATLTFAKGVIYEMSWLFFFRFLLLLSSIIPISVRVFMDMSKIFFSLKMSRDKKIPGTIVRSTTIPEELGRIEYLFSDKTGTLTQNHMIFKKLQLRPPLSYSCDNIELIQHNVMRSFARLKKRRKSGSRSQSPAPSEASFVSSVRDTRSRNNGGSNTRRRKKNADGTRLDGVQMAFLSSDSLFSEDTHGHSASALLKKHRHGSAAEQVSDIIESLGLCHNVTPIVSKTDGSIDYQASSPDEVALVKFTEQVGVSLIHRDNDYMTLRLRSPNDPYGADVEFSYEILQIFPFTSESKRMGIIVRCSETSKILFFAKGAESIMKLKIEPSEWLDEEVENLAREGLRTLVFARKFLSETQYQQFAERYATASVAMQNRAAQMQSVREQLEQDMELLGVTGVEDLLQHDVQPTLETLRNANINIWMLTGDKVETAQVIARSSRLVAYGQTMFPLIVKDKREALHKLDLFGAQTDAALVIDGKSLEIYMTYLKDQFIEYAVEASVVICCRCSPTQKAEMVELVQSYTGKCCAAIGDGGNDVAMIQSANVGVGIEGKEGQQASLAADFSITQFSHLSRLLLWHGRVAYKNSAKMSQFVIHRGLIIAIIQAFFSAIFYYSAVPIFTGWIAVGYATIFTSAPVFALVLDHDVSSDVALFYPELYHDLQKGRSLSKRSFLIWLLKSVYQGGMIMLLSLAFFDTSLHQIISITFTALILAELTNVMLEIKHWHWLMIVAELTSFIFYIASLFILEGYFDVNFIMEGKFWGYSLTTAAAACVPVFLFKVIHRKCHPSAHVKLKDQQWNRSLFPSTK